MRIPVLALVALAIGATPLSAAEFDSGLGMWVPWNKSAAKRSAANPVPHQPSPQASAKPADGKPGPDKLDGGPRPGISAKSPSTVSFASSYGAGSIVVDTAGRQLFYVLDGGKAYRYPISVGKQGFEWSGKSSISKVVSWPDWRPPAEMLERKPELPKLMTGGLYNPLGAKALYLGSSLYRIHGTNNTKSIGQAASSGCFRMLNGHVVHLATLAGVGTKVFVLKGLPKSVSAGIAGVTLDEVDG